MQNKNIKYIFFGSGALAESSLFTLYKNNLTPSLVITTPDKRSGRKMELQENIIKKWCQSKNIKFWQPESLKNLEISSSPLIEENFDLAIVASYPKILKENILKIPKYETLNIHPSKLPEYRGPSPIQSALLDGETKTYVSIIKLDNEIDHGPILIQKEIEILDEDNNEILERKCGAIGGELILQILPHYLEGSLRLIEQDHSKATFTRKFEKFEGEINLNDDAEIVQNKFKAFLPHIPIFFKINHKNKEIRIKVSKININREFAKGKLAKEIIEKVIPEGKNEMTFESFVNGYII